MLRRVECKESADEGAAAIGMAGDYFHGGGGGVVFQHSAACDGEAQGTAFKVAGREHAASAKGERRFGGMAADLCHSAAGEGAVETVGFHGVELQHAASGGRCADVAGFQGRDFYQAAAGVAAGEVQAVGAAHSDGSAAGVDERQLRLRVQCRQVHDSAACLCDLAEFGAAIHFYGFDLAGVVAYVACALPVYDEGAVAVCHMHVCEGPVGGFDHDRACRIGHLTYFHRQGA